VLENLSIAQLTGIYNQHAEKPVKSFKSKAAAIARIESLGNFVVETDADGTVRLALRGDAEQPQPELMAPAREPVVPPVEVEEPEEEEEEEEEEDEEEEEEEEEENKGGVLSFVKATKEELGLMDGVERQQYRKARRKAARALRKAKQKA